MLYVYPTGTRSQQWQQRSLNVYKNRTTGESINISTRDNFIARGAYSQYKVSRKISMAGFRKYSRRLTNALILACDKTNGYIEGMCSSISIAS